MLLLTEPSIILICQAKIQVQAPVPTIIMTFNWIKFK